ncbi:MAG: hypothetical protein NZM05_10320 [Chloroherpetonaceae bacterium]|nr:hypothetical protein [Chloroherpetonaceae bacterium]MCS7210248.1 hypothetical protein [Chloroherpetonaceae bacterium]
MAKNMRRYAIVGLTLLLLSGCVTGTEIRETVRDNNAIVVRVFPPTDPRSFFGIVGSNLVRYEPINLAQEFKQDSLRVRFSANILNRESPTGWGIPCEITSIERRQ